MGNDSLRENLETARVDFIRKDITKNPNYCALLPPGRHDKLLITDSRLLPSGWALCSAVPGQDDPHVASLDTLTVARSV
ncbi:hypothetical protein Tco_1102910 [Tanacetum coccineum]